MTTADTKRLLDDSAICEQVAAKLADYGIPGAYAEHMGGGIICVLVPESANREWFFGMANTTWGGQLMDTQTGDVWSNPRNGEAEYIEVSIPSDSQDAIAIAHALSQQLLTWRANQ